MQNRRSDDDGKAILLNEHGSRVDMGEFSIECMADENRVLASDEISTVIYVGDLKMRVVTGIAANPVTGDRPPDGIGHWAQNVVEIAILNFPAPTVRRQIGASVMSISADDVYIVRTEEGLRKVLGKNLQPGMTLETGEKVHQ